MIATLSKARVQAWALIMALAAMIVLAGWAVIRNGKDFDAEAFGIGAGTLIFGGGAGAAGTIYAKQRWGSAPGSRVIDDPDGEK